MFEGFCEDLVAGYAGTTPGVDNMERFSEFLADFPAGSSYKSVVYF